MAVGAIVQKQLRLRAHCSTTWRKQGCACPPLILQREHVDELIDKLTIAVNATLDFAKQEQLLA